MCLVIFNHFISFVFRGFFLCSIFVIDRQRLDKNMRRTRHSMHTAPNYKQREMCAVHKSTKIE